MFPDLYEFQEEVEEIIPHFSDVSSDSSMEIGSDNSESEMDFDANDDSDSDSSSSSSESN